MDPLAACGFPDRAYGMEVIPVENTGIRGYLGAVYGELHIPERELPIPLIILSHGLGGTHWDHLDYAHYFLEQGFAVFNFDFCGGSTQSQSEGSMLDMSVLTEEGDLETIVRHFKGDPRFSHIFLWGASQGGFVSACTAARVPDDVDAMILEFPGFIIPKYARENAGPNGRFPEKDSILGLDVGHVHCEDAVSFDAYELIQNYKGDVLIPHGDRDEIVPLRYSERAQQAYENAQLIVMPGEGHFLKSQPRIDAMVREAAFLKAHALSTTHI